MRYFSYYMVTSADLFCEILKMTVTTAFTFFINPSTQAIIVENAATATIGI